MKNVWKHCLHFLSFLNSQTAQVVEILPCERQGPVYTFKFKFKFKIFIVSTTTMYAYCSQYHDDARNQGIGSNGIDLVIWDNSGFENICLRNGYLG